MKLLASVTLAALAAAGVASAATGYSLNPKGAAFTASGPTQASKNGIVIACTSTFKGKIGTTGIGKISSATFSGGGFCSSVKALKLPWTVVAMSLTTAKVEQAEFSAGPLGTCGPNNVILTQSGTGHTGKFTFNTNFTGGCNAKSTAPLASTPAIYATKP